jgi:hypothetical protein
MLAYIIALFLGIVVAAWGGYKYHTHQKQPGSEISPQIQHKLVMYSYTLGLGLIMIIISLWLLSK